MTIQEIIADAQKLYDNIDRFAAIGGFKAASAYLTNARSMVSSAIGHLGAHATAATPAPESAAVPAAPAPAASSASTKSTPSS